MPISPIVVGSIHRPWAFTFLRDPDPVTQVQLPVDLTGAVVALRFSADSGVPAAFTGTGSITYTDRPNGKFTYQPVAADIAVAGNYHIQIVADYGSGSDEKSDAIPFYIIAAL